MPDERGTPRTASAPRRREDARAHDPVRGAPGSAAAPIALPPGLALLRRVPLPRKLGALERIYGRALAARGAAWVVTAAGVTWKLDLGDATQRWIVYGDYEGRTQVDWLRRWVAGGGAVVDAGASIGQTLLHLAPVRGVRVHAFEPIPCAAAWLRECLAVQRGWQVDVIEAALWDADGDVTMQVAGPHSTTRTDWYAHRALARLRVPAARLDDYAARAGIERIRLWKLDVEGAEARALAGARRLLGERRVDALLVEVSRDSFAAVSALLADHGYAAMRIERGGRLRRAAQSPAGTTNRVFLPRGSGR